MTSKEKTKSVYFQLPYIGKTSNQIENEIRKSLEKTATSYKLIMVHGTSTIGQYFKHKDTQSLLHTTAVVYQLKCSCGQNYIGQTRRNIKLRLKEHQPNNHGKSDVANHLIENPNHNIDFSNPKILAKDNNWRKLRIKETLLIQNFQPSLNSDDASVPLYLFNT